MKEKAKKSKKRICDDPVYKNHFVSYGKDFVKSLHHNTGER